MNRTIWMLWLQGWDQAPDVTLRCRDSFEAMNPGWTIQLLDATSYPRYLGTDNDWIVDLAPKIPPAALSDLIRIELLRRFGGTWADATVLCLRPLDEWLPLVADQTLFAFRDPGPDRRLSSWFLSAPGADPIVSAWWHQCRQYWDDHHSPDEYHWFHYQFAAALAESPHLEQMWSNTPYLGAQLPHHLLPHHRKLNAPPTAADLAVFSGSTTPVLKLTHKVDGDTRAPSNYATLIAPASRLAMHHPPKPGAGEDYSGVRLAVVTSRTPSQTESLRGGVVADYFFCRGFTVDVVTSASGGTDTDIIIDVRDDATEVDATERRCPIVAFNTRWETTTEPSGPPVFSFDLANGYLPYVDPAMLAPLPAINWASPTDTAVLVGFAHDSDALHTAKDLCHRIGFATEHIPGERLTTQNDLCAHAFGVSATPADAIFAERQALPCLALGDLTTWDEDSIASMTALDSAARETRRRRLVGHAEFTLASAFRVVSRLLP